MFIFFWETFGHTINNLLSNNDARLRNELSNTNAVCTLKEYWKIGGNYLHQNC